MPSIVRTSTIRTTLATILTPALLRAAAGACDSLAQTLTTQATQLRDLAQQ